MGGILCYWAPPPRAHVPCGDTHDVGLFLVRLASRPMSCSSPSARQGHLALFCVVCSDSIAYKFHILSTIFDNFVNSDVKLPTSATEKTNLRSFYILAALLPL